MASEESKSGAAAPNANELLGGLPLSAFPLPPAGKVVTVNSDLSILEAVNVLTKANILAAPVVNVDAAATAKWHERYLGLFDMTDVVWAALQMEEISTAPLPAIGEDNASPGATTPFDASFLHLVTSHAFFKTRKVADVLRTFRTGPFVALAESCTVLDAALVMGKYGQHRLMVVDESSSVLTNVITQSALVRFLANKELLGKMAPVVGKTLSELGLGSSGKVYSVDIDDAVVSAFTILAEQHVSAVAVLDGGGRIVGTISNRDARVIATSQQPLAILHGPVRSLFKAAAQSSVDIRHPSISASTTDTLGFVIEKLAATRIHRVFVAGPDGVPTGVVSLTDVLGALAAEPTPDYFASFFAARGVAEAAEKK